MMPHVTGHVTSLISHHFDSLDGTLVGVAGDEDDAGSHGDDLHA